jgi:hypothetical protein
VLVGATTAFFFAQRREQGAVAARVEKNFRAYLGDRPKNSKGRLATLGFQTMIDTFEDTPVSALERKPELVQEMLELTRAYAVSRRQSDN